MSTIHLMQNQQAIVSKVGAVVLVQDTFTGADSTELQTRASDIGGTCTKELANAAFIISNRATTTNNGDRVHAWECSQADNLDFSMEVDSGLSGAGCAGFIYRLQDANNYWQFMFRAGDTTKAWERSGGSYIQRDAGSSPVHGTYTVTGTIRGNTMNLLVDDVEDLSYTSASFNTETEHGLLLLSFSGQTTVVTVDNFSIVDAS